MPSSSKKQHDFMEAIAHNKAFAKKVHVPQSVGRDFAEADKGKHFKRGGNMAMNPKAAQAMAALMGAARRRPAARAPMAAPMAPPASPMAQPASPMAPAMGAPGMAHGGLTKAHHKHLAHHHLSMAEHHMHMHEGGMKHGGKAKHHYAKGGAIGVAESKASGGKKEMKEESREMKSGLSSIEKGEKKRAHGEHGIQQKGHTRAMMPKMAGTTTGMKHGGKAKVHHKK